MTKINELFEQWHSWFEHHHGESFLALAGIITLIFGGIYRTSIKATFIWCVDRVKVKILEFKLFKNRIKQDRECYEIVNDWRINATTHSTAAQTGNHILNTVIPAFTNVSPLLKQQLTQYLSQCLILIEELEEEYALGEDSEMQKSKWWALHASKLEHQLDGLFETSITKIPQ